MHASPSMPLVDVDIVAGATIAMGKDVSFGVWSLEMTLPVLHFRTNQMHPDEGFERWRALMAPIYHIEKARGARKSPVGETITYLFENVLINRTIFEA